jgi:hypothetical protein
VDPTLAFYTVDHSADEQRLVPSALTRGPWHANHQHGGPPAALLARAFEALAPPAEWQLARFTIEFLRPVPLDAMLQLSAAPTRSGQQVLTLAGQLSADDRPLARAHALCVRKVPLSLPPGVLPPARPLDPEAFPSFTFPFFRAAVGYHTAMEVRLESGVIGGGPAVAWLRPRHPLVLGESTSALQRVLIAADAINGIGFALDLERYTFVNADLTVYLHRLPVGPWLRLAASPSPQSTGVGLVEAELGDCHGPIGRALEAQVLRVRHEPPTR